MKNVDLVIVGAGVIGATLAWNLRDSGLDVLVVDRAQPGSVTTTWSFAWMNASSKVRLGYVPEYVALSVDASHDPYELSLDIPGHWLHATGNLELVASDEAGRLEADVRQLVALGYAAQFLEHDQLARLHPELQLERGTVAGWYPTEGWIDGPALVEEIVDQLSASKVSFRRDEVIDFECDLDSRNITTVRLASGEQVTTSRVVLSAGAWTADLAALVGVDVALTPRSAPAVSGLIVRATAPQDGLHHQVMGPGFLVRPHRAGEVLLAGEGNGIELAPDADPDLITRAARDLLACASSSVPALMGSHVITAGVGLRPLPEDGVSIVGPSDAVPNLYVSVTHSGVSLAPLLGKLLARELLTGQPEAALEPFRLTRFN